jgi:rod shape-determining protein MreC
MTPWKRYRDVAIVALLLALPFFLLRSHMKDPAQLNAVDRFLLRISAPIEYVAATLARGTTNVWTDYVYLVDVKADNERLSYDNARLREQVHELEHVQTENQDLRRLLQLRQSIPTDSVSALVVVKSYNEFFRVTRLVLDRGSRDVKPYMPVVAPDGIVGTVLNVVGDEVTVLLAVDASFGVDVEDVRTKARGFVRGTGDPSKHLCRVEMVDSRDEVEVGDLLVTSGKGKRFPGGLPVARVTKVVKRELGRDQEVEASPAVDFTRLDSALILLTTGEETPPPESTAGGKKP